MTRLRGVIGIVVIGRNEGDRLDSCLRSVVRQAATVIYVDSGSTDDSLAIAGRFAVTTVALDMTVPFNAARARNAGYQRLNELEPHFEFVQFVDGDCELADGWVRNAVDFLRGRRQIAAVAGTLKEKYPQASIYNRIGDMEWNFRGSGEVDSVGGIFVVRRVAFDAVGGFNPTIAAGEEPELCERLIDAGWRIWKINQSMASHDLAITTFRQWWKRMVRFGYGSCDVAHRFGLRRFRRNNWRAAFWSGWLFVAVAAVTMTLGSDIEYWSALLLFGILGFWPLQMARISVRMWRNGHPARAALAYSLFLMVSFWPQMLGQLMYAADRLANRSLRVVEYKAPTKPWH